MSHAMPPIRRTIKNVVHNFSDSQIKVREATSNDPWGPSSTLMAEIADLTYNVVAFSEIMQMIWKRLNDHGKNWRHVYKALTLLDYLIKTGSEKVAQQCKENIFAIQTLKDFMYVEENKDQGVNVREKAKQLVALLKDDERLKNERARALKAKERFAQSQGGFSSKDVDRAAGGSGGNTPTLPSGPDFAGGGGGGGGSGVFASGGAAAAAASGGGGSGSGGSGPHRQRTLSEIEAARPQTAGEEELQLQLALAISKEEADDEEKKKRADALRLDMAIAESKHGEGDKDAVGAPAGAAAATVAASASPARGAAASAALPSSQLLDLSLGGGASAAAAAAAPMNDPWSTAPAAAAAAAAPAQEKKDDDWLSGVTTTATSSDPWGMPAAAPTPVVAAPAVPAMDPWGSPTPAAPSPSRQMASGSGSRTTSPWGEPIAPTAAARSVSPAAATIAINGKSSPWGCESTSSPSQNAAVASSSDLFDLSGLEPALNEKSTLTPSHQHHHQGAGSNQGSPAHGSGGKPKRSPEDFLGANSALVNLDALVAGAKKADGAVVGVAPDNNNPFAMSGASLLSSSSSSSTAPASTAAANPFLTPSAKGLPLNQMKAQTAWGDMGGLPAQTTTTAVAAASSPFPPTGGLQQQQQPAPMSQQQALPPPFVGSTPLVPFASSTSGGAAHGKSSPFAAAAAADSSSSLAFGNAANNNTATGGNPFLL